MGIIDVLVLVTLVALFFFASGAIASHYFSKWIDAKATEKYNHYLRAKTKQSFSHNG